MLQLRRVRMWGMWRGVPGRKPERRSDSAAKLILTSTQWLMAFPPESVCAAAGVIISGGCGGALSHLILPPPSAHTSSVFPSQTWPGLQFSFGEAPLWFSEAWGGRGAEEAFVEQLAGTGGPRGGAAAAAAAAVNQGGPGGGGSAVPLIICLLPQRTGNRASSGCPVSGRCRLFLRWSSDGCRWCWGARLLGSPPAGEPVW